MRTALRPVAVALAVTIAAGCGGGDDGGAARTTVATALVPPTLGSGKLSLREDRTAHKQFGRIQGGSLVDDGRLWAVRDGDRLVATLQLSTLDPKVDLGDSDERSSLVSSLLPGTKERFTVGDLDVIAVSTDDKTVFLWFGDGMFEVLQIKTSDFDHEKLLGELIAFQTSSPAWDPPPTVED